ncbi:hypothetical protein Tco_1006517 [Tanacetum coccineum]|uniref:Uncharacterized protein n=1 Tax=Tanacetum coccineum TaxID=301880 RepID=A0ABQ5FIH7_9ASTR
MAKSSSHNPSSPEITPKEELVTLDKPESPNPFLVADQIEFSFDEIAITTNNEEAFTGASTQYKEYMCEFWYTAKTLDDSKIWVSTPIGGIRRDIDYAKLIWEDIIHKLNKKTREKVVPYPRPYREGFGAFPWWIPILVTISKTILCHLKLFEGSKVQLGEDPIRAQRGGLRAREEEMDFKSFMVQGADGEFNFLPEGGLDENRSSTKSNVAGKRKAVVGSHGEDPHQKARKVSAQASKVTDDTSTRLDVDSDPDIHDKPDPSTVCRVKDATDCYWVVAHVTPPSWKQYLRDISIEHLCDIHDKAYMRQAVLDNVLNGRTR